MKIPTLGCRLTINRILLYAFFIPFSLPNIVGIVPVLRPIWIICQLWKVTALIIGGMWVFYSISRNGKLPSVVVFLLSLFQMSLLMSTAVRGGDIIQAIEVLLQVVIVGAVIEFAAELAWEDLVDSLYVIFGFWMLTDLVFMIMWPHVIESYAGIFGNKNNHIFPILLFIILLVLKRGTKVAFIGMYLLSVMCVLLTRSATSCIALGIVTLLFLLVYVLKISNWLWFRLIFCGVLIISLAVVTSQLEAILNVVITLLNKTATFGREHIWQVAWKNIREAPLMGMGYEFEEVLKEKVRYTHMHNKLLDVMYTGGIVALILWISSIGAVVGKMVKYRLTEIKLMFSVLVGWLIVYIFEGKRYDYLFGMALVLIYARMRVLNKENECD